MYMLAFYSSFLVDLQRNQAHAPLLKGHMPSCLTSMSDSLLLTAELKGQSLYCSPNEVNLSHKSDTSPFCDTNIVIRCNKRASQSTLCREVVMRKFAGEHPL
eukprot:scaffold310290_cov13-Tisochrysis_lutea.AAC.1